MGRRRALLVGIPEYNSDVFPDLPVVRRDVDILREVLEASGYTVRSHGVSSPLEGTRSGITSALRKACREAQRGETLLLYFSGHGIHYRGKDYLVPIDIDPTDHFRLEEYLVSTDLTDAVDESAAETIVFLIDACREGIKLDAKSIGLVGWSQGERRKAIKRSFALVLSCQSGQVSQFVSGEDGFSLFSRAFAEVFRPEHPATTLKQVINAAQARLDVLAREKGKQSQTICYFIEGTAEGDPLERVICNSILAEPSRQTHSIPWTKAAQESFLWNPDKGASTSVVDQLKPAINALVNACWEQWQQAKQSFPQDPWRDEGFPIRILERLEFIVLRSDPPIALTVAEAALLLSAPFIREAVLAAGISRVADAKPLSLDPTGETTGLRSGLEKVHQARPQLVRKAKRLEEQGLQKERDAVAAWLFYRYLLREPELWLYEPQGYLSVDFHNALAEAEKSSSPVVAETMRSDRLLELARCVHTDPERIERQDQANRLQAKVWAAGGQVQEQQIRERLLGYLLNLAGWIAIDVRTLSEVVVDHIGLADPLVPEDVLRIVATARWTPDGVGRTLSVICQHPAMDFALREHVRQCSAVLDFVQRRIEGHSDLELLQSLPPRLTDHGITAVKINSIPAYETPHLRFQLAHDEVRELLMGQSLYGDPALAIRELYQNALDACRYREARLAYLKYKPRGTESEFAWEGRLIFRQGLENGRPYIECEDNGIGMGHRELTECFARAGKRFSDMPEFIEEQAEWLRGDPPIRLYPNSQFGIGVFSYFMMADELEVETCRLDRKGRPGKQLHVRVSGSGSFFRVRELGLGTEAGTRIRLYLNQTKPTRISCSQTLRRLLRIAEFRTEVNEYGQRSVWEPEVLDHPELTQTDILSTNHPDVWWSGRRNGALLSDGIANETPWYPPIIANLRREHRPQLTVDRKKIVKWDGSWLSNILEERGWKPLLGWPHLTFDWLWNLWPYYPRLTGKIVDMLWQEHKSLRIGGDNALHELTLPIRDLGWFPGDQSLLDHMSDLKRMPGIDRTAPHWFLRHRLAYWERYGLSVPSEFWSSLGWKT